MKKAESFNFTTIEEWATSAKSKKFIGKSRKEIYQEDPKWHRAFYDFSEEHKGLAANHIWLQVIGR